MKTLKNIIMAAALYAGCVGGKPETPDNTEPVYEPFEFKRCRAIMTFRTFELNEEITQALYDTMHINFCTKVYESNAADGKCMIASPYDGSILVDPVSYLPKEERFVKMAHEYGHILAGDIHQREYIETLLAWDSCVYTPRFGEMERNADRFAGYITAAAGIASAYGVSFMEDGHYGAYYHQVNCHEDDLPDCVARHYSNEERVEEFMNGYNRYIEE